MSKKWRPKEDEIVWNVFIQNHPVKVGVSWSEFMRYRKNQPSYNYFRTKKEADEAKRGIIALLKSKLSSGV